MASYAGTGQAKLLRENQQGYMFQREAVVAGRASVAFQLDRIRGSYYPNGASIEIAFTDANGNPADPGACEIDIQTADTDQDSRFVTTSTFSGGASLNASFAGRVELTTIYAKYIRAFVKTLTNAVYVSVLATR